MLNGISRDCLNTLTAGIAGKETTVIEYVIWGIASGEVDERVLFTRATSMKHAEAIIKVLVAKHGCSAMRVQKLNMNSTCGALLNEFKRSCNA